MASGKIKGITVEIGGDTTKLGKAIGDIEAKSNSLKGELKQVEKLLKMDPGNVELIAQKQEILTRAVSETSEKLEILKSTQEQVEAQFKNGDIGEDQYRAFQREIVKTENELSGFRTDLDKTNDELKNSGKSAEDSSEGFTIMKGAIADMVSNAITNAISSIGDFIGSILELSEATEEYRTMQAKLAGSSETFGYSAEYATEKYKEFYKYLGDDQASTNAITNLMGIGTSTESLTSLVEGCTSAWATYGDSINVESLTEAVNETITCGKVTGSFADTINWCKDANDNLKDALSGNEKAQKAYVDAIEEGLPVEDAFNEALAKITDEQERADVVAQFLNSTYGESKKTYDELNKSVIDANDAELKLKDTQAKLGEAVAPVNTAITNLKDKALQAITPIVEQLATAFMDLYKWIQENPTVMTILQGVAIALASAFAILAGALAIQGLISGVTKAFQFLNTTLLANPIVLIIALITGLVAGFIYLWNNCEAFREFWINLWDKIKSVTSEVSAVLVEFFTVTVPNAWETFKQKSSEVIEAVVSYFSGLGEKIWTGLSDAITKVTTWGNEVKTKATTAVQNLVNTVVNWFKQLPGKIQTWLTNTVTKIVTWGNNMKTKATTAVQNLVTSVVNWMKQLPDKIWNAISGAVTKVATWGSQIKSKAVTAITNMVSNVFSKANEIPGKIYTAISGAFSKITSWGSQMVSKAGTAVTNISNKIVSGLKGIPSKVTSVGSDIIRGLWNGISNMAGWIKDKISGFGDGVLNSLKNFFGIKSPSRLMRDEVGRYIAEGIGVGITDNEDKPIDALESLSDEMVNGVNGINGATINRKLVTTFNVGSADSINNNTALLSKLDNIYERLNRLQIVLDTGTLVGEAIDKIDAGLASRQLLSARGV